MPKKTDITEDDFRRLLRMFSPDDEEAARGYEEVRRGLIRYFRFRGCDNEEELTDETFNRVALKSASIEFDGRVKLITYFLSFATRIYLEHLRRQKRLVQKADEIRNEFLRSNFSEPVPDDRRECLDKCLGSGASQDRILLIGYYSGEKNPAHRKELAAAHGISLINLHTKASRIRSRVADCVRNCLRQS